jgi:hypothetical protein
MMPRELSDSIGDLMETMSGLLIEHDDGQTTVEEFRAKMQKAVSEFIEKHKGDYPFIEVRTRPVLNSVEVEFSIKDPDTAFEYESGLKVRRFD